MQQAVSGIGHLMQSSSPKYGLWIVGGITALAAVGLFFAVRRKSPAGLSGSDNLGGSGLGLPKGRRFKAKGKPRTLGRVDSYGPTQIATLYVGRTRGEQSPNRTGKCSSMRRTARVEDMDNAFLKIRSSQVGRDNTGGTRITGQGWYQGKPEDSVSYSVIHIPNDRESSYGKFKRNMNKLAEAMGKAMCQDEVIVVHSDGNRQKSCGAVWYDRKRGSC